jgi:multiple sugar transport system substrate-binding protein
MFQKMILRSFGAMLSGLLLLSACAPAAPAATPTTGPTQTPYTIEVTRIVAGTPVVQQVQITTTPAPQPTAAPQATVTAQATAAPASKDHPVELHVGVSFAANELQVWIPQFQTLGANHPEWILVMDQTPFDSNNEKITANAAAGTLPCVQEVPGAFVNQYIQQGAFLSLDNYIANAKMDMTDFWPHVMEEWQWQGKTYGIPAVAAPELLYFNKKMFDAAKMAYPTDNWTMDDFAKAAIQLTLDKNGKNPTDPAFDPKNIKQWGYNASPGSLSIWAHVYVEPWGGSFCADTACTRVVMTTTEDLQALNFWYDLVEKNHAGLYDPYSGAQTGVPGDPLIAGQTAMGEDGFFAIGQIETSTNFPFGVRQIPKGPVGRSSALSTRGYTIAANCKYPDEAFKLIQELTNSKFLHDMWAVPGISVPARRSSAQAILDMKPPLDGTQSVLAAMEYAHGFRPNGPGGFEAYIQTYSTSQDVFAGKLSVIDGYTKVAQMANDILAKAGTK